MSAEAPQGTFSFSGGISPEQVLRFSVAQQHGLTPSIISVRMIIPLDGEPPEKNGDVELSYDTTKIVLKNCTIDKIERPDDEKLEWEVTLLDRRWLWRYAKVSGVFNARWKNGTELREETKDLPSRLAEWCLIQMDEKNYDLGALKKFDKLDWPEINWDMADAANALQELCERYGCRAIYRPRTDNVVIVKIGDGQELDVSGKIPFESNSLVFDPPEKPGKIVLVMGPTSVQADLPLYPVGVEVDGRILPINRLSYSPEVLPSESGIDMSSGTYIDLAKGLWDRAGVGFYGVSQPYLRRLAEQCIYRMYRIHPPKKWPGLNRAWGDSAASKPDLENWPNVDQNSPQTWLWRISLQSDQNDPLSKLVDPLNTKIDQYNNEVGASGMPAWVYGQYVYGSANVLVDTMTTTLGGFPIVAKYGIQKLNPKLVKSSLQQQTASTPNKNDPITLKLSVISSGFYLGGFSIDSDWGLVRFNEPVYQLAQPKQKSKMGLTAVLSSGSKLSDIIADQVANFPATLWLRTRFLLRDPNTRGWVRAERVRVLDKSNPATRYVVRNDLVFKMTLRPSGAPNISTYPATFDNATWAFYDTTENNVVKAADAYLDDIEKEYQTRKPQSVVYCGFYPFDLDGAIREIVWYTDDAGFARTRVSRDQEFLVWHQDYSERRLVERLVARESNAVNASKTLQTPQRNQVDAARSSARMIV